MHSAHFADPIALFQAAVDALNAEDWERAASLCDPVSLKAFHRQLISDFAPSSPRPHLTAEEYLRHAPDMPREVAEYHVAQHKKFSDPAGRLREELPTIGSVDEIRARDPRSVFASWLEGRSVRYQVERLVAEGHADPTASARLNEDARLTRRAYVPLGTVFDGDRLAHVLYRDEASERGSAEVSANWFRNLPADEQELARDMWGRIRPSVATCRRQAKGTWLLVAEQGFFEGGSVMVALGPNGHDAGDDVGAV